MLCLHLFTQPVKEFCSLAYDNHSNFSPWTSPTTTQRSLSFDAIIVSWTQLQIEKSKSLHLDNCEGISIDRQPGANSRHLVKPFSFSRRYCLKLDAWANHFSFWYIFLLFVSNFFFIYSHHLYSLGCQFKIFFVLVYSRLNKDFQRVFFF